MELIRWIADLTPRYRFSKNSMKNDDEFTEQMMASLVVNEIDKVVVQVEMEKVAEQTASMVRYRVADYSWLATDDSARRRKNLSLQERISLENICGRVYANEWSDVITNWRSRIQSATDRNQIIEAFELAVQDITSSRPHHRTFPTFTLNFFGRRLPRNYVVNVTPKTEGAELNAISPRIYGANA